MVVIDNNNIYVSIALHPKYIIVHRAAIGNKLYLHSDYSIFEDDIRKDFDEGQVQYIKEWLMINNNDIKMLLEKTIPKKTKEIEDPSQLSLF